MDDITSNESINECSNLNDDGKSASFSPEGYKRFSELPLVVLNALPYSVYIIDYSWTYIFLNDHSKTLFEADMRDLTGRSALDVFRAPKFHEIFEAIRDGVENRFSTTNRIYSPMRGQQVLIKGVPLEDCYLFTACTLPGKDELLQELRAELMRNKVIGAP